MARTGDSTYIYYKGASPNTRVAISQKNRVYSKPYGSQGQRFQVGVLSTFDWSESRTIDPVRGVGFGDRVQELVPNVTEPPTLTLNRTLLYTSGIMQEVGYRGGIDGLVRSLRHHKWPFDIRSELVFSELVRRADQQIYSGGEGVENLNDTEGNLAVVTMFHACWLNNISISFPSDSAIVMEDASATAMDVTDGTGLIASRYNDSIRSGNNPWLDGTGSGSDLYQPYT